MFHRLFCPLRGLVCGVFYLSQNMFTNTEAPGTLTNAVGAVKGDLDDISALTIGAAVLGTGVVGTSVLIAGYVAPAPIIGGAIGSGALAYFGHKATQDKRDAKKGKQLKSDSTPESGVTESADELATATV